MAGSREITAGRAAVRASLDDSGLVRGLQSASKKVQAWGSSIMGVGAGLAGFGAAGLGALFGAATAFSEMGSELNDMSDRTGMGVENLSALKFAAEQSGASLGDVESASRKMSKTIAAAAGGSAGAKKILTGLGLSLEDLQGAEVGEQFAIISGALAGIEDEGERAAMTMQIFGKSGTKLTPMISQMDALTNRAAELGLVWSKEDAEKADAFGDTLDELWAVLKQGVASVGGALVPAFQTLIGWIVQGVVAVVSFIKNNQGLIIGIAMGLAVVTALGIGLMVLGGAISAVGVALGVLAVAIKLVVGLFLLITSPIGLIVIALAAAAAAILYFTGAGKDALGVLGEVFGTLKDTALEAFGGISDALKAGDIALAGKIALQGLKVIWAQILLTMQQTFFKWIGDIKGKFLELTDTLAESMVKLGLLKLMAGGEIAEQQAAILRMAIAGEKAAADRLANAEGGGDAEELANAQASLEMAKARTAEAAKAAKLGPEAAVMDALRDNANVRKQNAALEQDNAVQKAKDDLEAAKADLAALRQEAADKANKPEAFKGPFQGPMLPKELEQKLSGLETVGTFNAAAAGQLGAKSLVKDQLDQAKQTNKLLGEIKDAIGEEFD